MDINNYHPKEQFKFCPFCGTKDAFKFDGTKKLKCEKCERSFYINAASATAAIIETPKGILFVRRKLEPRKGMLDLPGGFVDLHESVENAITRELAEEINLNEKVEMKFFCSGNNNYVFNNLLYVTLDIFFYIYLANIDDLVASDDALSIEYIKPSKINFDEIAFDSVKIAIAKWVEENMDRLKKDESNNSNCCCCSKDGND